MPNGVSVSLLSTGAGGESFVPEGARCRALPGWTPDVPRWKDAPDEESERAERLSILGKGVDDEDLDALRESPDTLVLWHLLTAPNGDVRAVAYERLAELYEPPVAATRAVVLGPDGEARDEALESWRVSLALNWYIAGSPW